MTIGEQSVVAANAVITRNVPANEVWGGASEVSRPPAPAPTPAMASSIPIPNVRALRSMVPARGHEPPHTHCATVEQPTPNAPGQLSLDHACTAPQTEYVVTDRHPCSQRPASSATKIARVTATVSHRSSATHPTDIQRTSTKTMEYHSCVPLSPAPLLAVEDVWRVVVCRSDHGANGIRAVGAAHEIDLKARSRQDFRAAGAENAQVVVLV